MTKRVEVEEEEGVVDTRTEESEEDEGAGGIPKK